MKILFLSPYSPIPPNYGAATRIYQLLKYVSQRHQVTFVFFGSTEETKDLKEHFPELINIVSVPKPFRMRYRRTSQILNLLGSESYYYASIHSRKFQKVLDTLCERTEFDLVHYEFPVMAVYNIMGSPIRVLDAHNVEFFNLKRMYQKTTFGLRKLFYMREYKLAYKKEVELCKKLDIILTTSEYDKAKFDKEVPNVAKYVIPNGVDGEFFAPFNREGEPNTLIFTGMMGYMPNDDGMIYFLKQIYPQILKKVPDLKLYVVGMSPTKELLAYQNDQVVITGKVDDVRPYVEKASVYIVPLRMGSGTRLKVLEALAMKKPVVTTSIGCEGIDVTDNTSVLIKDDPDKFAEAIIKLLGDRQLQNQLAEAGYKLIHSKYTWQFVGKHLLSIYDSLEHRNLKLSEIGANGSETKNVPSDVEAKIEDDKG